MKKAIGFVAKALVVAFVLLIILVLGVVGWLRYTPHNRFPAAAIEALREDRNAAFYAILPERGGDTSESGFRSFPVLGKTVVSSDADRQHLADLMVESSKGAWDPAACFNPRHAFRVSGSSGTFDILLCYECGRAQVFGPDGFHKQVLIRGTAAKMDDYLKSRGLAVR